MDIQKIKEVFRFSPAQIRILIGGFILSLLAAFGFGVYRYYYTNYYDSSSNGSEIKEREQQTIPQDVQKRILQEKKQETKKETPPPGIRTPVLPKAIRVPILMYHYVEYVQNQKDKTRMLLNTLPPILDQQIKTLVDAGYSFMTGRELAEVLDGEKTLPLKPILLTFDDGYRDFYTDAFPILKKYHVKATNYVVPGFLNRSNHLLTTQMSELIQSGLVEIGAHTVHHVWLKGKSLKDVTAEVAQSKTMLETQFGISVVSFAYPFGAFDEQAIQVVKSVGFKTAVSTIPGIVHTQENRFFLYRLRPGIRIGPSLLAWLNQEKFSGY